MFNRVTLPFLSECHLTTIQGLFTRDPGWPGIPRPTEMMCLYGPKVPAGGINFVLREKTERETSSVEYYEATAMLLSPFSKCTL